jgi:hypothetical protein
MQAPRLFAALRPLPRFARLAVDTSFHTYDGFAETVDAFRLVSMIFGDPRYETLVMIVATVGIGLGAIIASVRGTAWAWSPSASRSSSAPALRRAHRHDRHGPCL